MGVTGLLPAVESAGALRKAVLADIAGTVVAVDSYCLLHRGAFACGTALATGGTSDMYIKYCMKYVNMLLSHSIKPILVFDGRHLPAKAQTELKRREARNSAKQRAAELLRIGKTDEARSFLKRCVDITHEMAFELIKECRRRNVDCIVAPYEADAQLAYLNKIGVADVVVTEDSDLILFGCSRIAFKLDLNGNCCLFDSSKLHSVMKCPLERYEFKKFRQMCILSGCDYLASLPGIGLAKARQFINATRDPDISNALKKIPNFFNKSQLVVTDEYREGFMMAEATFLHQFVYDPLRRKLVRLSDPKEEGTDPKYLCNAGDAISDEIAFDLALGNLDPFTLKRFDSWHPDRAPDYSSERKMSWNKELIAPHKSIWSKDYVQYMNQRHNKQKKSSVNVAILTKPTTRNVTVKVACPIIKNDDNDRLTIEDLASMYVIKEKSVTIVPETQDFEDTETFDFGNNSKNESPVKKSLKRSLSPVRSPILENNDRSYKKLMKANSFSHLTKISKFERTVIVEGTEVKSKFFSMTNSEPIMQTTQESGLNISGISKLNMDDEEMPDETCSPEKENFSKAATCSDALEDKTSSANDNSITNRRITSSAFDWGAYSNDTTSKNPIALNHQENKTRNPFKKQNVDSTEKKISTDSGFGSGQDIQTTCDIVLKEDISNKILKDCDKPKVVQLCRRPGLAKKKPINVSAGQKLLTTFGFEKKSQLKH